ncbi:MAG: glutamate-cysteine ligase family protein [Eubacteriaceae bacterium]|nr:glutamate-cysteine ligase family protein [Eubacteriaceae bacterium]
MDCTDKNLELIADYIRSGEKKVQDAKLGIEAEHLVVDKETRKTIDHFDDNGNSKVLDMLMEFYPEPTYVDGKVMGLKRERSYITTEPAGQIECSLVPMSTLEEISNEYGTFLTQANKVLQKSSQELVSIGYHPVSRIDEIKTIPKERYSYMYEHFSKTGNHGHNMMKGTCSLQVAIDYFDEEDFSRKLKVAGHLSALIFFLTSNVERFEGETAPNMLRMLIWEDTDPERCGIIPGSLSGSFGYRDYAKYVYDRKPITIIQGNNTVGTGEKTLNEIYKTKEMSQEEIDWALTMFFPDVRAKKYLELRSSDAMDFAESIALCALMKGIFYTSFFERVYRFFSAFGEEDERKARFELKEYGGSSKIYRVDASELIKDLIDGAYEHLDQERELILPMYQRLRDKSENSRTLFAQVAAKRRLI